jgi:hypothetical protein
MTSLVQFGVQHVHTNETKAVVQQSLQRWYDQFRLPERGRRQRVALVDNSLLARVAVLLGTRPDTDSPRCTAEGLIALNAWLHAFILYDSVVHLENADVTPKGWLDGTQLGRALRELACDIHSDRGARQFPGLHEYLDTVLGTGRVASRNLLAEENVKQRIWKLWSSIFGLSGGASPRPGWANGPSFDELSYDKSWVAQEWSSDAKTITETLTSDALYLSPENLLDADEGNRLNRQTLPIVLTDACVRAHTNMFIATRAGVTYVPSPIRMPALLEMKAREIESWLKGEEQFLGAIRAETKKRPAIRDFVDSTQVRLPPLLAVALSQSSTLGDLVGVAGQLRSEARGIRRLLAEIEGGDEQALSRYDQAWTEAELQLAKLPVSVGAKVGKVVLKGGGIYALGHVAPGAAGAHAAGFIGELIRPAANWSQKVLDWSQRKLDAAATADAQGALQTLRDRLTKRPGVFIAHLVRSDRGAAIAGDQQAFQRLWGIDNDRAKLIGRRIEQFSAAAKPKRR